MPLLHGYHGRRHHLVISMRTKYFLNLYFSHLIHDHHIQFNSRDIDLESIPPDDLADYTYRLPAKESAATPLIIFALPPAPKFEYAARFLSTQDVKLSFASYPSGSRRSFDTQISNREYIAAMRSHILALVHRRIGGVRLSAVAAQTRQ